VDCKQHDISMQCAATIQILFDIDMLQMLFTYSF